MVKNLQKQAGFKSEIEEIKKIVENIEGWLGNEVGEFLYKAAKRVSGKGVIVEVGSWKGKSTVWLAKGSKAGANVKVYSIDPHTGSPEHVRKYGKIWTFEEFKKNIKNAGCEDIVIPLVKTSEGAARRWDKPIEFIFIDGAHEYESVKQDFELWFPHVIEGGVMAFHDTVGNWEGPKRVVKEFIYSSRNFKNVGFAGSATFGTKIKENTTFDRLRNKHILFLKNVYELVGKVNLPKAIITAGRKFLFLTRTEKD